MQGRELLRQPLSGPRSGARSVSDATGEHYCKVTQYHTGFGYMDRIAHDVLGALRIPYSLSALLIQPACPRTTDTNWSESFRDVATAREYNKRGTP